MSKLRNRTCYRIIFSFLFVSTLYFIYILLSFEKHELSRHKILLPFQKSDEPVSAIQDSTTLFLTFSIPKSGTTALSWMARSLFENIKKEIDDSSHNDKVTVYSPDRQETIILDGKKSVFFSGRKHKGQLHHCMNGKIMKALEYPFEHHVNNFLKHNRSTRSKVIKHVLRNSRALNQIIINHDSKCRSTVKHVAIFRDPIATAVSYQKYFFPKSTKEEISNVLMTKTCNKRPALTAILWILCTEILPDYGIHVEVRFFKDLRQNPRKFVMEFSKLLGLDVTEGVIEAVVQETSPENMRDVQERMKILKWNSAQLKTLKKRYQGLSGKGENSRKVRTASLKGYQKEISPEALEYCIERARFHLPDELIEAFEL